MFSNSKKRTQKQISSTMLRLITQSLIPRASFNYARFSSAQAFERVLPQGATTSVHKCGDHVRVYVDRDVFGWIVMDKAGSSANALGDQFMDSAGKAIDLCDQLFAEKKIRAAIITSAKDTFCVGADLEQVYPITQVDEARKVSQMGQNFFERLSNAKYPVIAAINGLALGGGCELALACHHRVISNTASIGLPETLIGLLPGAGGTVRLQRLIGVQNALKIILAGKSERAEKAVKLGIVDSVVPGVDTVKDEFLFFKGARSFAEKVVEKKTKPSEGKKKSWKDWLLEDTSIGRGIITNQSVAMLNKQTKGKYIAQYSALECVLYAAGHRHKEALDFESKKFAELCVSPEAKNQIALFFLDDSMKRVEKKTGIKPKEIQKVSKVGVMGAGVMGSGIAHYLALKDHSVYMKDLKQEFVDKGLAFINGEFQAAHAKKKLDDVKFQKLKSSVSGGTKDDDFRACDVIIEAAVEVMDVKKKMLQQLEASGILDGKRLFATNTSSLSITELQSVSKYPECVVGMHFFNPVSKMPLIEVIMGKQTSRAAAATIYQLSLKIGKKPIIVQDGPGFLVNRILGAYMAEAGRLAQDGANPDEVDKLIVKFGMPMGPFRLLDEVGLDIACHVGPVLTNGLKHDKFKVDDAVEKMVKEGNLGKKNKKGFYSYDEKGKETGMNMENVSKYFTKPFKTAFSAKDILDRCVLLMINEASLILQDKITESPEDVDIGMIFGTGFPPFRGGLMQHADHLGIKNIVDRLNELNGKYGDRFKPSAILEEMASSGKRFYNNRPYVPYKERNGFPQVQKH